MLHEKHNMDIDEEEEPGLHYVPLLDFNLNWEPYVASILCHFSFDTLPFVDENLNPVGLLMNNQRIQVYIPEGDEMQYPVDSAVLLRTDSPDFIRYYLSPGHQDRISY